MFPILQMWICLNWIWYIQAFGIQRNRLFGTTCYWDIWLAKSLIKQNRVLIWHCVTKWMKSTVGGELARMHPCKIVWEKTPYLSTYLCTMYTKICCTQFFESLKLGFLNRLSEIGSNKEHDKMAQNIHVVVCKLRWLY